MAQPSGVYTLNWRDVVKGAALAAITAVSTGIYQAIQLEGFAFNWIVFKPIVLSAASAFLAYLIKNFFTNNVGQVAQSDKPTVVVSQEQAKKI